MEICAICGKPAECTHHLVFGMGKRSLADADDLVIPMCNYHHNMADRLTDRIHDNSMAESLSKMLGQAIWERHWIAQIEKNEGLEEFARAEFIKRYGRSWL